MKNNKAPLSLPVAEGYGTLDGEFAASTARASVLERWRARKLLALTGDPPLRLVLWGGEEIAACPGAPIARLLIRDRGALFKLLRHPDLHFGDLYSLGRIEVEGDLVGFLEAAYRAAAGARVRKHLKSVLDWINRPRANSLTGSKKNIHHHYDLGNDFYKLWLDREAMQYTCAYYPRAEMTLEEAQRAKMDYVCRKLELKPGQRVVEAGCGWGGLARHMARHYGVKVRSYNISREQIAHARAQARAEGLAERVEYIEDDYRNATGTYDAFVSVGMLEHVGKDHYRTLGEVADRCLTARGRGLIHSIGRNRPEPMNTWIEKRIFPGAYPPTIAEMMEIFEPNGFSVLDVENLRLHYARTLAHWLERFDRHQERIEEHFDRAFMRAWRLYLAGSQAAFTSGSLQLFQAVFARATDNDLPWSRAHLYT